VDEVDEVDERAVHRCPEVVETVGPVLDVPPVEPAAPMVDEALDERDGDTAGPPRARDLAGPARALEPLPQVVERRLVDPDAERLGCGGHRRRGNAQATTASS
jgi:hypothetical protein